MIAGTTSYHNCSTGHKYRLLDNEPELIILTAYSLEFLTLWR